MSRVAMNVRSTREVHRKQMSVLVMCEEEARDVNKEGQKSAKSHGTASLRL